MQSAFNEIFVQNLSHTDNLVFSENQIADCRVDSKTPVWSQVFPLDSDSLLVW